MRLWPWLVLVGCYRTVPATPCTVSCDFAANEACPEPLECHADGLCHAIGVMGCESPEAGTEGVGGPNNTMFVTSTEFTGGNLGGLDGVDQKCMDAAMGHFTGTFHAWVSTNVATAESRLGNARGWIRADGKPFADKISDLLAGHILYPPRVDELGLDHPQGEFAVLTGTLPNGLSSSANCDDFTNNANGFATIGRPDATTDAWTDEGTQISCANGAFHLYCFQIDSSNPLEFTPPPGKHAFVTGTDLQVGLMGLSGADALCNSETAMTPLADETFKALLATSTSNAEGRFPVDGPWLRVDGVEIGDLTTPLFAPLNVTARGVYRTGAVWSGAADVGSVGTMTTTCDDWTNAAFGGTQGIVNRSNSVFFNAGNATTCSAAARPVYCLAE